ncbi:hypothetical protein [Bradyrhizobium sp. CCBAU 51745]|uniref:hypothetical protein n=1 Tax=Bradyrhizobium sp. CCBAU 51745 TaxID=1325099 RepID=UPI00230536D9|nr:hypothetical protein [Bradyrhizobium sp. CCBAU 51745]
MADSSHSAMPCTHAAAMSPTHANAGSDAAAAANSPSAAAAAAATTATAATTASSEQRSRRCDQQGRYGGYCKQLGELRHDDLLFAINSARLTQGNTTRLDGVGKSSARSNVPHKG